MSTEENINKFLFLYLVNEANKKIKGPIEGQKKLLKLIFLAELQMLKTKLKGLNYYFFRYQNGPFSKEVYEDRDILIENDLIRDVPGFELTEKGKILLKDLSNIFEGKNHVFVEIINQIIQKYGKYPSWKLEQLCYELEIRGVKIKDLPMGTPIIKGLSDYQAKQLYQVDPNLLETLEIYLDKELDEELTEALERAQKEEAHPYGGIA